MIYSRPLLTLIDFFLANEKKRMKTNHMTVSLCKWSSNPSFISFFSIFFLTGGLKLSQ